MTQTFGKPIPKPTSGEEKNHFVSRCIKVILDAEPKTPQVQAIAICEETWRNSQKCEQCVGTTNCAEMQPKFFVLGDIISRLESVKDLLIARFGEVGRSFYEATLVRLGVYDPKSQKYNCNLLKSDIKLPFVKESNDTHFVLGNMVLAERAFDKIDEETHTVSGYANTLVCDCAGDIVLPESYKESAEKYSNPIFFMHHTDIAAGKLTESKMDEIGWYVKTQPYPAFWALIKDGTLKGFSIGGWFTGNAVRQGEAYVWTYGVNVEDISYVSRPCNKLSFFEETKTEPFTSTGSTANVDVHSKSFTMTDGHTVSVAKKVNKEERKMSINTNETCACTETKENKEIIDEQKPLTNQEKIQAILDQYEKEGEEKVLKALQKQRATDEKAQEESRLSALEKKFGEFQASLTSQLNEFFGKFEVLNIRMTKMEIEPEKKVTAPITTNPLDVAAEMANSEGNLHSMLDKVEKMRGSQQ